MKKLFFIMAMSVCAFTAQAQTTSGIRVGLNMTSATGKYNDLMADQDYNNKSYMGYSIHYSPSSFTAMPQLSCPRCCSAYRAE